MARDLADRTGIPATFVQADVLDAAAMLGSTYDMVSTMRGVLMWIADLARWADNCVKLLRPGGVLYLLDIHPLGMAPYPIENGFKLSSSYFGGQQPRVSSADASYAVSGIGLEHQETHEWVHPIGDVIRALAAAGLVIDLLAAGLVIDLLHEHSTDAQSPTSLSSSPSDQVFRNCRHVLGPGSPARG